MKTILAALVAGLLGGGAVVGAVASGVVPMEALAARESKVKSAPAEDTGIAALEEENAQLREKINVQSKELGDLGSDLKRTRNDLDEMNKKLADTASKSDLAKLASGAPAATSEPEAPPVEGAAPAVSTPNSPEYRAAWRAEQEAYEKERQEQRRLNQQAERITALEARKVALAESIPKIVASQAQRLNLNETQVKACSDALLAHAIKRAELFSSVQEKRINDEDVDQELVQQLTADLDAATKAALMGSVDEKTAESLLQMANRPGGRNTADTGRRGGQGGGRGN
ncbi:MAG: hypothetical protein KBG84_07270 [Planctomycetes bacterium]|nr:hypothetical protein [Planctomycetota bacterium]